MHASTPAGSAAGERGFHTPAFGRPSPALLARADRGYARFLALPAPEAATCDHGRDDLHRSGAKGLSSHGSPAARSSCTAE
ncbi:hypothetical protein [Streptomyces sp. NPDC051014]|uniref:hypothetical protein n=1 Tax=Streptomyces sp. NPDC051014 TaxID=3155751 RepID=UPI0033F0387B